MKTIKKVFGFVTGFLGDQWRQYDSFGQLLFVLALGAISVDAMVSYQYGQSITKTHAIGYALLAIVFALLPDIAAREADRKKYASAIALGILGIPLGLVALQSHIGYTGGVRLGEMTEVAFHEQKLDGAKKVRDGEASNVDLWRKRHADLSEQKRDLLKQAPWAATVTAVSLREELANLDGKIAAEVAGGRGGRKAGCKTECERLKDQRKDVSAKIDNTERLGTLDKELAKLDAQITATQKLMVDSTKAVTDVGIKQSLVVHQNGVLSKVAHLVGVEADAESVSLASASSTSIAFMILAPLLMFSAGRNRRPEYMVGKTPTHVEPEKATPATIVDGYRPEEPQQSVTFSKVTQGDLNRAMIQDILARIPSSRVNFKTA